MVNSFMNLCVKDDPKTTHPQRHRCRQVDGPLDPQDIHKAMRREAPWGRVAGGGLWVEMIGPDTRELSMLNYWTIDTYVNLLWSPLNTPKPKFDISWYKPCKYTCMTNWRKWALYFSQQEVNLVRSLEIYNSSHDEWRGDEVRRLPSSCAEGDFMFRRSCNFNQ